MQVVYPKVYFGDRLVNRDSAKLDVASSAVLYGLSIYTVFPVSIRKPGVQVAFRLKEHFERLQDSSKIIGIDGFSDGWSFERFSTVVSALIRANRVKKDVFVRASLHVDEILPGTRSRGLSTKLSMFAYEAQPILPQQGARLKSSIWRRVPDYSIPSRAKVNGAYVNSVLAKQEAIDTGYDDCIFLDDRGHVCELSAANIFLIKGGKLITPDAASDLLEGINRRTILALANEIGLGTEERAIDLTELYVADELFACGTSAFIAPIIEVDARKISDGKPGPITKDLQNLHKKIRGGLNKKHANWLTYI